MGLFDRLKDYKSKCPRCGASFGEIQTKDLVNLMETFDVYYPDYEKLPESFRDDYNFAEAHQLKYIDAIGCCVSASCHMIAGMISIAQYSWKSGFGLCWDVRYPVNDEGIVTGPYELMEEPDHYLIIGDEKLTEDEIAERFLAKVENLKVEGSSHLTAEEFCENWDRAMKLALGQPKMAVLYLWMF